MISMIVTYGMHFSQRASEAPPLDIRSVSLWKLYLVLYCDVT